jgi:hypothetical protein
MNELLVPDLDQLRRVATTYTRHLVEKLKFLKDLKDEPHDEYVERWRALGVYLQNLLDLENEVKVLEPSLALKLLPLWSNDVLDSDRFIDHNDPCLSLRLCNGSYIKIKDLHGNLLARSEKFFALYYGAQIKIFDIVSGTRVKKLSGSHVALHDEFAVVSESDNLVQTWHLTAEEPVKIAEIELEMKAKSTFIRFNGTTVLVVRFSNWYRDSDNVVEVDVFDRSFNVIDHCMIQCYNPNLYVAGVELVNDCKLWHLNDTSNYSGSLVLGDDPFPGRGGRVIAKGGRGGHYHLWQGQAFELRNGHWKQLLIE